MIRYPYPGADPLGAERFDWAKKAISELSESDASLTPALAKLMNAVLAFLALQDNNSELAREQYAALESERNTLLGYSILSTDRLLGLLAHTMGNLEAAEGHFEDAVAFCREAGYRTELAWSLCDYADMLLDPSTSSGRTAEGDRHNKAMRLLDESLKISTELGMRPLMERVLSRREILKA